MSNDHAHLSWCELGFHSWNEHNACKVCGVRA